MKKRKGDPNEAPRFNRYIIDDYNPLSGHRKRRVIYDPNVKMREIHEKLKQYLHLDLRIRLPYATGCMPGSSPVRHIKPHRFNRYFYLTDISDAYGSVDGEKLAEILFRLNHGKTSQAKIFAYLQKYCLAVEGGLAVGAPASPILFNIYADALIDQPLARICEKFCLVYNRYLDDITISGEEPIGRKKRKTFLEAIRGAGLNIAHHKTRVLDITKGPIMICGFMLDATGRISLPRRYQSKIQGLLHSALNDRPVSHSKIAGYNGIFSMCMDEDIPRSPKELKILSLLFSYKKMRTLQKNASKQHHSRKQAVQSKRVSMMIRKNRKSAEP